jgi:heavy metal translocating P-type ATPase
LEKINSNKVEIKKGKLKFELRTLMRARRTAGRVEMRMTNAARHEQAGCALCGLALPRDPVTDREGAAYCCPGCAHVAAIVRSVGPDSDEARRRLEAARCSGLLSSPLPEKPESLSSPLSQRSGLLSSPLAQKSAAEIPAQAREEIRLRVQGLVCPSCAWLVEAVVARQPGVAEVEVDFLSDAARVVFDLRATSREAIETEIARAGYGVAPLESDSDAEGRRDLMRLAVAFVIDCNQMMLAFVGYDVFMHGGGDPQARFIPILQVLLALPVVTWCAMPLYRRALAALRAGRAVMETLLALGIAAAFALSVAAMLGGGIHMYLETATSLATISLAGRVLERWLKQRAARSLGAILQPGPTKARRAGDERFAPLARFNEGDRIRVEPGEIVPLDVRAMSEAVVREGLLTGEPHPVARRAGEIVLAGSRVERGTLLGAVERRAGETVADAIRGRVAEALRRTDAGSRAADRLAQGFVPLVLLLAASAAVGHRLHGDPFGAAMLAGVAVLVAACPCAFGVAASSAISLALLGLARRGVLVKDPATIEALRSIDTVILDKTGTLTKGDLDLIRIGWLETKQPVESGTGWQPVQEKHRLPTCTTSEGLELLAAVRAIEEKSRHPIGVSLARVLEKIEGLEAEGIVETPGIGVTGMVKGRRVAVGTLALFSEPNGRNGLNGLNGHSGHSTTSIGSIKSIMSIASTAPLPGVSRVWFGYAGEAPAGYIDLADRLRPEAGEFVEACQARGIEVAVYSGDAAEATRAMAESAGIAAAFGNLRPEEKAARVRALREQGRRVLYVGDGFNDAEALAAADAGVAMGAGANLALLTAPVVIARGDLRAVVELCDTARRAGRIVRQNFAWAFVYNIALLPVAALGYLAPIYAAGLMALSSASVAINSMRARRGGNGLVDAVDVVDEMDAMDSMDPMDSMDLMDISEAPVQ